MTDIVEILPYFAGANTWLALAGLALFVFLVLFRATATDFAVRMNVPRRQAAGVVHVFMLLVALVALTTLSFAFLDARDARAAEAAEAARAAYEQQLQERQGKVEQCIASAVREANFVLTFESDEQGVRCPGGGCFGQSGNCNKREGWVSYSAPGDYFIETYALRRGAMNHGNIAGLEVHQRDREGRATAVRARIWCDPDNRIGAPGGWANASVEGTVRLRNESEVRSAILTSCNEQYPAPIPPS